MKGLNSDLIVMMMVATMIVAVFIAVLAGGINGILENAAAETIQKQ